MGLQQPMRKMVELGNKTKTKRLKDGGVSVPFMVTREMVRELLSMGYNKKEINKMKSEEAHEIIINS